MGKWVILDCQNRRNCQNCEPEFGLPQKSSAQAHGSDLRDLGLWLSCYFKRINLDFLRAVILGRATPTSCQ